MCIRDRYYRHARIVDRAALRSLELWDAQSSALFAQFVGWRSRLSNVDFSVHRERVHVRAPHLLDSDPELVLRLFEFVAHHGIPLSNEAVNQLEARLSRLREYFEEPRHLWPALNQIFSQQHAPPVSYTHLDVYKRQGRDVRKLPVRFRQ